MRGSALTKFDLTDTSARLSVTRLRLSHFRCYDEAAFDGDERPVVLTGPNGAGKTNMLEAISYLGPGRGLRRARLADVDQRGGDAAWAVSATVSGLVGSVELGTGRDPLSTRRAVRVNGAAASGQSALADHVSIVWLTPQMDRLFLEGAAARRRFLDRLVFGFDSTHAGRISAYEHAMRERVRLLKIGRRDDSWLSALEETMAGCGIAIAAARRDMAGRLARACAEASGPFPAAGIAAIGQIEGWLEEGPALAAEDGSYGDRFPSERFRCAPPGKGHASRSVLDWRTEGLAYCCRSGQRTTAGGGMRYSAFVAA